MKKRWYLLVLILLFSIGILNVKAISNAYSNNIIIEALQNNEWQVSKNSNLYEINILIGTYSGSNSIHDEFLGDPPNSNVVVYLCSQKTCSYENYNEIIPFRINKKDDNVWLSANNISQDLYNSLHSYKYHTYEAITNKETSSVTTQFNQNHLVENLETTSSSSYANNAIISALRNNNWEVSKDGDLFEINILIGKNGTGNYRLDEFLRNPPNSNVVVYLCNKKNCSYENYNEIIPFRVNKKNDEVWLTAQNITLNLYDALKTYKYHTYEVITKKETTTSNKTFSTSTLHENFGSSGESGDDVGKNHNPLIIKNKKTVTIPAKDDSYWNDVGDNKCYYIKFDFSSKTDTPNARYKIIPSDEAWSNIFWANDPSSNLATRLVADLYDNDIFQVSSANTYAICNSQGQTFSFEYKDAEQLNCGTTMQVQAVEAQNGKDACKLNTSSDIKSHKAEEGKFNPDNLCGRNDEYCNLDLTLFCTDAHVARTFKFLGILISLAKVLVPALIIGFGIMDIVKIVISGQEADAKKYAKNIFIRIVIGIVIFLLPTFLITIYNIAQGISSNGEAVVESSELAVPVDFQNCVNCILDINKCDIE